MKKGKRLIGTGHKIKKNKLKIRSEEKTKQM
jgi:hypothetical protein